jgi:hypothetical protein
MKRYLMVKLLFVIFIFNINLIFASEDKEQSSLLRYCEYQIRWIQETSDNLQLYYFSPRFLNPEVSSLDASMSETEIKENIGQHDLYIHIEMYKNSKTVNEFDNFFDKQEQNRSILYLDPQITNPQDIQLDPHLLNEIALHPTDPMRNLMPLMIPNAVKTFMQHMEATLLTNISLFDVNKKLKKEDKAKGPSNPIKRKLFTVRYPINYSYLVSSTRDQKRVIDLFLDLNPEEENVDEETLTPVGELLSRLSISELFVAQLYTALRKTRPEEINGIKINYINRK